MKRNDRPEDFLHELSASDLNSDDLNSDDLTWANMLSRASQENLERENEPALAELALQAVNKERAVQQADAWAKLLSEAAQLRSVDQASIGPVLQGVQAERVRLKVVGRRNFVASFAALALVATVAAVFLLRPNAVGAADPMVAYDAYAEVSSGW